MKQKVLIAKGKLTLRKSLALLLVIAMLAAVLLLAPIALETQKTAAELAAEMLYELGLFHGYVLPEDGALDFGLDDDATRIQGMIMFLRFIGEEKIALAGLNDEPIVDNEDMEFDDIFDDPFGDDDEGFNFDDDEFDFDDEFGENENDEFDFDDDETAPKTTYDCPFTDIDRDDYRAIVGYAYEKGYTQGVSATEFAPDSPLTAAQFLTFVLRALGYVDGIDFEWDKSWELTDKLGITYGQFDEDNNTLKRNDMVQIAALTIMTATNTNTGNSLFEDMLLADVFTADEAVDALIAFTEVIVAFFEEDIFDEDQVEALLDTVNATADTLVKNDILDKNAADDIADAVKEALEEIQEPEPEPETPPNQQPGSGTNTNTNNDFPFTPPPGPSSRSITISAAKTADHNKLEVTLSAHIEDVAFTVSGGGVTATVTSLYDQPSRTYTLTVDNGFFKHLQAYTVTAVKEGYRDGTRDFNADLTAHVIEFKGLDWRDDVDTPAPQLYEYMTINYDRKIAVKSNELIITPVPNSTPSFRLWYSYSESNYLSVNSNAFYAYGLRDGSSVNNGAVWAASTSDELAKRALVDETNQFLLPAGTRIRIEIIVVVDSVGGGYYDGIYTISTEYVITASDVTRTSVLPSGETPESLAAAYKGKHATALALTTATVLTSHETIVTAALTEYDALNYQVKDLLTTEKTLLDSLKAKIENIKLDPARLTALTTAINNGSIISGDEKMGLPSYMIDSETAGTTYLFYCGSRSVTLVPPTGWSVKSPDTTSVTLAGATLTSLTLETPGRETYKLIFTPTAYFDVKFSPGASGTVTFADNEGAYPSINSDSGIVITLTDSIKITTTGDTVPLVVPNPPGTPVIPVPIAADGAITLTSSKYTLYVAKPMVRNITSFIVGETDTSTQTSSNGTLSLTVNTGKTEQYVLILDIEDLLGDWTATGNNFKAFRQVTSPTPGTLDEMYPYYRVFTAEPPATALEWVPFREPETAAVAHSTLGSVLAFWHFPEGADPGAPPMDGEDSLTDGKSNIYVGNTAHERYFFFIGDNDTYEYLKVVVE